MWFTASSKGFFILTLAQRLRLVPFLLALWRFGYQRVNHNAIMPQYQNAYLLTIKLAIVVKLPPTFKVATVLAPAT